MSRGCGSRPSITMGVFARSSIPTWCSRSSWCQVATPPPWTRLGGLLTVQLRPIEKDRIHGSVNVDILDSSLALRAPLTERLGASIAIRQGYLDTVLKQVTSRDVGEFFPIPRYTDGQARFVYSFSEHETAEVGGFLSSDRIERTVSSPDPAAGKARDQDPRVSAYYARYRKRGTDGTETTVTPWFGTDSRSLESRFGVTPTNLTQDSEIYGLRVAHRARPAPFLSATIGLDGEFDRSHLARTGSITSPAREGDVYVFGQPPSDQINADAWEVASGSLAPFAEMDLALLGDRLHLIPGLRIDPYFVSVNRRAPTKGLPPRWGCST